MIFWLLIAIILAIFGVIEILLNFTIPFVALRTILLFLLVIGMAYRIYLMEQGGEKEDLKRKVRELEDKLRERELETE
jgi:Tfp pilus assembly protein PilO